MCGRFGFTLIADTWSRYEIEAPPTHISTRYNIAPSQEALVVTRNSPKKGQLMQFGLLPFWAKENKGYVINARSETIFEKTMFKKSVVERRCLIPASFFFEWKRTPEIKIPYAFKLKDEELFSFAGIYNETKIDGKNILSFAIITTSPNDLMRSVHDRMPVILSREEEDEWLDPDMIEPERIKKFLDPYPALEMKSWKISTLVNKPQNDFKEILNPLSSESEKKLEDQESYQNPKLIKNSK